MSTLTGDSCLYGCVKYEYYINLYTFYDGAFGLGRFGCFLCRFAVKHVILNGRMSACGGVVNMYIVDLVTLCLIVLSFILFVKGWNNLMKGKNNYTVVVYCCLEQ